MVETHTEKIHNYLKKNLAKGYTEEALKWSLIQQGYTRTDVQRALERVGKERAQREAMREKPVITREVYDESNMPSVSMPNESPWYSSGTFWFFVVLILIALAIWAKRSGYW